MHFARRAGAAAGLPDRRDRVLDAVGRWKVAGVERTRGLLRTLPPASFSAARAVRDLRPSVHISGATKLRSAHGDVPCRQAMDARAAARSFGVQSRRDALLPEAEKTRETPAEPPQETELDATFSFSSREVLQHADFETMTSEEIAQAKKMLANLRPAHPGNPHPALRTRPRRRAESTCARACAQA